MTADYIAFHAADRPDAIAIITNGRSVTYAELSRNIRKFTRALRGLGLPRGSSAAIDCEDLYFSWLLRLAFEQLGIVTATMTLRVRPGAAQDFDILLSGSDVPGGGARRFHRTTPQWLQGIVEGPDADEAAPLEKQPDDPIRIVRTSGTTGTPKTLLYTRRIHETSITRFLWFAGFTPRSRYLLALSSTVAGPTACMRAGGTVVIETRMPVGEAIATHLITHTTLPPLALKRVLDELPRDYTKPAELRILSFGAKISPTLREKALVRLAADLCDIYSSNEAGYFSSTSGTDDIGTIWPDVRVEVVDEVDRPLGFGEAGRIRVGTDYMVHGYLDDPGATQRVFRDSWFYPGDIGILHDSRRLQVIGRHDDVLNIGWRKIAPEPIEDLVIKSAEVADAGVCSMVNADGIEELWIVVSGSRGSDDEILRRITDAFRGVQFGKFHVIRTVSIPRTPNGKIQRRALKEIVAASARSGH